jgi:hypothetical protein
MSNCPGLELRIPGFPALDAIADYQFPAIEKCIFSRKIRETLKEFIGK